MENMNQKLGFLCNVNDYLPPRPFCSEFLKRLDNIFKLVGAINFCPDLALMHPFPYLGQMISVILEHQNDILPFASAQETRANQSRSKGQHRRRAHLDKRLAGLKKRVAFTVEVAWDSNMINNMIIHQTLILQDVNHIIFPRIVDHLISAQILAELHIARRAGRGNMTSKHFGHLDCENPTPSRAPIDKNLVSGRDI